MASTSLELAIIAIRSGRKEEGRQLLNLLIQQNPNDDKAWLWMSSVVDNDEQRARCLYHVLAINPESKLAQRGLQKLGIVVSDSRPVRAIRDSQPIAIPKPTPQTEAYPLPIETDSKPVSPVKELHPFRLDPQTVINELPFTPVTQPFERIKEVVTSKFVQPLPEPTAQVVAIPPSQPVPVVQMPITPPSQPVPVVQMPVAVPITPPSQPVPVVQMPITPPSQPVPIAGRQANLQPAPVVQTQVAPQPEITPYTIVQGGTVTPSSTPVPVIQTDSQPMAVMHTYVVSQPTQSYIAQQPILPGTRPTNPVNQPFNPNARMLPHTRPTQPIHSDATMGIPVQQIHTNSTINMPVPPQPNGYTTHPSEPVPVIHSNATMGMQVSQGVAATHSNGTVMMQQPVQNQALSQNTPPSGEIDYRLAFAAIAQSNQQQNKNNTDDEEPVNILAVIIFGSLSMTALGGLGMLVLLIFTTG